MFGTFLRKERKRLLVDSKDAATALQLTETYYRLVEAGRATFNQSLALRLADYLHDRAASAGVEPLNVHFKRLAIFLVGAHLVGAEMVAVGGAGSDQVAMDRLAERDSDFELFHSRTRRYYDLREGPLRHAFLEDVAAPEVATFLASVAYADATDGAKLVEQVLSSKTLLALPSASLEMVIGLTANLAGRPFMHTREIAPKWEESHARLFVRVSGVYETPNLILDEANLASFHYPYLSARGFKEVRFLFLEPGNAAKTKTAFIRGLERGRVGAGVPLSPLDHRKVSVIHATEADLARHGEGLRALRTAAPSGVDQLEFQAYWSFETGIQLPIGFVGIRTGAAENIWNLSLAESFQRQRAYDLIWSALASRTR
jgi:hypothetical protein